MSDPGDSMKPRNPKPGELSVADIADKLYTAILEHRLPPGTKLAEGRLVNIFGVNRTRIREVLTRLAYERVVELVPYQGAYVFKPSVRDTMGVFEARRVIEPFVVDKLVSAASTSAVEQLSKHLEREAEARRNQERPRIIRLSAEFHILLAELAGNASLLRSTRELTTHTCLAICAYSNSTDTSCRDDEHAWIVEAIRKQDVTSAIRLMLDHLDHILKSLNLHEAQDEVDLESLFSNL